MSYYPPGCTDADITEHFGDDEDEEKNERARAIAEDAAFEAYRERSLGR